MEFKRDDGSNRFNSLGITEDNQPHLFSNIS